MNERTRELYVGAFQVFNKCDENYEEMFDKFADSMIAEFSDVVKAAANELAEHYYRQGCSEEEVLMRVNGALVVLGHIRERFKD